MKSSKVVQLAEKIVSRLKTLNDAGEDISEVLRLIETCNHTNIITAMGKISHIIGKRDSMMEGNNPEDFEILQDISNNGALSQFSGMILYGYRNDQEKYGFF